MEVFLYNSTVCRLCGEENDNGSLLYSCEENSQSLGEIINAYLPIKVSDDGQLPRTVCPGCAIQLEATVEFLNLIINGQKLIRELHQREKDYRKSLVNNHDYDKEEVVTEKIVYEFNTVNGVYQVEHPVSLKVAGLEKPKRKRGRPPKKPKTPEELAEEAAAKKIETSAPKKPERNEEPSGKRKRKAPTRFKEVVQGKELERIFIEEGMTDGEESDREPKVEPSEPRPPREPREPEVIGHMETSGELVVVVKGKGRGRPKGRTRPTREECAICGLTFSCVGRYMSHVAAHGRVLYQCAACGQAFVARLAFTAHQRDSGHVGRNVIPCRDPERRDARRPHAPHRATADVKPNAPQSQTDESQGPLAAPEASPAPSLPALEPPPAEPASAEVSPQTSPTKKEPEEVPTPEPVEEEVVEVKGKAKIKCGQCDKVFGTRQAKSMHTKAIHGGERPYCCGECGATFAYPRSLALHAVSHRRRALARGYACDLCGKVLNHPSSVVYHKAAEHAGQRYVCGKCGKHFKHRQLLQRHQLVHSQLRPFSCKTCNASFKTKANLVNHQLLHSGVKKFSCEICKHRFAHKTSLTLHMRWHTGIKPYSCNVCGKSFSQKGNLSEHERIHTGEKPYACALCPRRFTTSSQRRLHARRHAVPPPPGLKRLPVRGGAAAVPRVERALLNRHARLVRNRNLLKQPSKQISLLVNDKSQLQQQQLQAEQLQLQQLQAEQVHLQQLQAEQVHLQQLQAEEVRADSPADDERVIYVAYDVDDSEAFHILDPDQVASLKGAVFTGTSLLAPAAHTALPAPPTHSPHVTQILTTHNTPPHQPKIEIEEQYELEEDIETTEIEEQLVLNDQNISVRDALGNPLHFTMQDGTRLAIASVDGNSLQVITQDGQTIPVEINGYAEHEEEIELGGSPAVDDTKEDDVGSPVTYFTIV